MEPTVFTARPPSSPAPAGDLYLVRMASRAFTGAAGFLADPANRAQTEEYLVDLGRPYRRELSAAVSGHSYAEMAETLIGGLVPAGEPVGLLVLAFDVHDVRPGQPAAAYLSHVTPGAPLAFAVCDQGTAAPFSGLRIARDYMSSAGIGRALLILAEQAALPYHCPAPLPARHQGVAMLLGAGRGDARPQARLAGLRQHPGTAPADVAGLADADLAELASAVRQVSLVVSPPLAGLWAGDAARTRVTPAGQPFTGIWRDLAAELARADLVVVADYDPGLRYLCLAGFSPAARDLR